MGNWINNIAFMGLGALAFYGYEKSGLKVRYGKQHKGSRARRHLGGIYEAIAWEQAGGPPGISMAGHANRKRKGSRNRRRR